VKGAPEYVIQHCTKILQEDGESRDLEEDEREAVLNEEIIEKFAKKGLRTILYAYKDMDSDEWERL